MMTLGVALGECLRQHRQLDVLGVFFGEMLCRRGKVTGDAGDSLAVLASLTVKAVRDGNSCLDLEAWCRQLLSKAETGWKLTPEELDEFRNTLMQWREHLEEIPEAVMSRNHREASAPLVRMDSQAGGTRIYLNRFYAYETDIVEFFSRLEDNHPDCPPVTSDRVHGASERFGLREFESDPQQQAVFQSLSSRVRIITGGPGTGKTTVLAIVLALELQRNGDLRIALCAPTGKASARMKESINRALSEDLSPDLRQTVGRRLEDVPATTLHTLLGLRPDSDYPRMNRESPLPADLVVVDECSMMSLQQFSQLLSALRPQTRLILLGDPNQLASVDAGNVLSELCSFLPAQLISRLVTNYRSQKNVALDTFSRCTVGLGDGPADVGGLYAGTGPAQGNGGVFQGYELPSRHGEIASALEHVLKTTLELMGSGVIRGWSKVGSVEDAMAMVERFKILCAVREGACGVTALNDLMCRILNVRGSYANGVPIMVRRNDGNSGLRNGDIGVCFGGQVHFRQGDRMVAYYPMELPAHERAFAMTIHKSQGSDYENVLMVLPEKDTPIITRELVYTGITRTKTNFTLLAPRSILEMALERPIQRWSGLSERLVTAERD